MLKMTKQSGQALVAATVGLVTLIGATGLAIDVGYLRYQKRLQQSAADSAAIAGAGDISYVTDGASITNTATNDITLNGFPPGPKVNITVHTPSSQPPYAGNRNSVEVLLSVDQPTFFMKIFGYTQATITARAVALATGKNCIYGLGPALGIAGTPTTRNCGLIDNKALEDAGSVPAADPLAYLKPPAIPRRPNCLDGNVPGSNPPLPPPPPKVLNPGVYCTGITVSGNATAQFRAGTYIVTGTGITFNGTGSVTGNGVTFYLNAGGVAVNHPQLPPPGSTETMDLVAPTAGNYAGILFYQDRGDPTASTIDGSGNPTLQGALYFPDATLNLSDTGSGAAYTIAVAKFLALSGTTNFPDDYTSLPNGSPVKTAVLVE